MDDAVDSQDSLPPDITTLLAKAWKLAETFAHERDGETLKQIVRVIKQMNEQGYDFIWDRRRHIVGATKRKSTLGGKIDGEMDEGEKGGTGGTR